MARIWLRPSDFQRRACCSLHVRCVSCPRRYRLRAVYSLRLLSRCISRAAPHHSSPSAGVSKEKPEDIVTIEPNRKPVRRDVVGYQLAIFILVCATVLLALRCGSASAEVDGLQAQLEEQYRDRYEEGYADAESTAYESGYDAGCKDGYSTGYADGDAAGRSAILSAYYDELRFFRNGACIVTEEGYRYHHYGCHHIAGREYWIYNTELAEYKGYSPCIDCWEDGLLTIILS